MESLESKKHFDAGDVIIAQGDIGQNAYIIEEGLVEILITKANGDVITVGTRGPGTIIGEMAIVDDQPRTATVRAVESCKLLEITRADFAGRLKNTDPVIQTVSQVILTRFRDTLKRADFIHDPVSRTAEDQERTLWAQSNAVEKIKMANDLKAALEGSDQLFMYYQPIINLNRGTVDGFEALMRWEHPVRGFVSPAEFIPVAEDTGLIIDASRWAFREACSALKRIEGKVGYDHDLFMSVNFSSTDFAEENFLDHLYAIISETDIDPHKAHLEITERLLMTQPQNAKKTLDLCRKAGLTIAIDDFGTGYSSLSYLHHYPINKMKIDRSFVKNMQDDESARNLVKSIVMLGKNMNMAIVAEGVEHKEEAEMLKNMGCEEAQGFYFARPSPEKDVIEMLKNWHPEEHV